VSAREGGSRSAPPRAATGAAFRRGRPRAALALVATLTAAAVLALVPVSSARAALDFGACPGTRAFECASLDVALDPSGAAPGTISLEVRRLISTRGKPGALLALQGGPGGSGTAVAAGLAGDLRPVLNQRQFVVIDQRGTGLSGPLNCPALQRTSTDTTADTRIAALVAECGDRLGGRRSFYTTTESVEDLEAVRRALGVERISLYGVSYGTYVAQRYARRYPERTERLVLDSTVAQDGPDLFSRPTFAAVRRVLGALCAKRACGGITADPVADVAALVARLEAKGLRGTAFDARGRGQTVRVGRPSFLLDFLVAGDFNPVLRAFFPAAVKSALRGDPAPLLRFASGGAEGSPEPLRSLSVGLFATTVCEETPLPWPGPAAPLEARPAQTGAAFASIAPEALAPFDRTTAAAEATSALCARWPVTNVAPPPAPGQIDAPTLVIGGEDDLRTPVEEDLRAAALIPGASVVTLAGAGHGTLGQDATGCLGVALRRFFGGAAVGAPCAGRRNPKLAPRPIPPTSLRAVRGVSGLPKRQGRTLGAVLDGIEDTNFLALAAAFAGAPDPFVSGGLRGGRFLVASAGKRLAIGFDRFSYVPGVVVSGTVSVRGDSLDGGSLKISGRDAARGTLRFARGGRVLGTLGGRKVAGRLAASASAAAAGRMRGLPRPRSVQPPRFARLVGPAPRRLG